MRERPLTFVPLSAIILLVIGLCAQMLWHFSHPIKPSGAEKLPDPPALHVLQLASFGEPVALSKILLLYLQTFDDQPGVRSAFRALDYDEVETWLNLTLQLDPRSQYPLFLASRIYGASGDLTRQRKMFDFVYRQFFIDPNRRWDSLAYAAIMTRHRQKDLPKAHFYAQALREHVTDKNVPSWVRQMDIFILEDMTDYGKAAELLRALLQSGEVTDLAEYQFLTHRLNKIEAKLRTKPIPFTLKAKSPS